MKRLNMFLVTILLLVAALIGCKPTENVVKQSTAGEQVYSYIDIDPLVIGETWEFVTTVPYDQFTVELYYRNPDQDASIQFATVMVNALGRIPAYSYMLNGKINVCWFNNETDAFESTWDALTDEHRAQWKSDYEEFFKLGGV